MIHFPVLCILQYRVKITLLNSLSALKALTLWVMGLHVKSETQRSKWLGACPRYRIQLKAVLGQAPFPVPTALCRVTFHPFQLPCCLFHGALQSLN